MPRENHVAKQRRIGERLSRAMVKAHVDRRELAALTGYSKAQILSWELGRAELYPTELIKLCHALDVMPEWLLCWERRLHSSVARALAVPLILATALVRLDLLLTSHCPNTFQMIASAAISSMHMITRRPIWFRYCTSDFLCTGVQLR
jgi:transcriptional regulator with XRE-family HTH domain